jgi:hypothetical protein
MENLGYSVPRAVFVSVGTDSRLEPIRRYCYLIQTH